MQLGRRPDVPPVRLGREAGWHAASAAVLGTASCARILCAGRHAHALLSPHHRLALAVATFMYVGVCMWSRLHVDPQAFLFRSGAMLHKPVGATWTKAQEGNWKTMVVFESRHPADVDRLEALLHRRYMGDE